MRLKSETFISRYRQQMSWKSFSGSFGVFVYSDSKLIPLWLCDVKINNFKLFCTALSNSYPIALQGGIAGRQFVPFLWWSLVWPRWDANSRPTVWEVDTLTTKPTRHGNSGTSYCCKFKNICMQWNSRYPYQMFALHWIYDTTTPSLSFG